MATRNDLEHEDLANALGGDNPAFRDMQLMDLRSLWYDSQGAVPGAMGDRRVYLAADNDFSSNSNVKAVWRFENNLEDSQNSFHLTGVNAPSYEPVAPLQGEYSLKLEGILEQHATRPDSDGMPLYSADPVGSFTLLSRVRMVDFASPGYIVSKYALDGRRSIGVQVTNEAGGPVFRAYQGYNNGADAEIQNHTALLSAGVSYAVAYVYDHANTLWRIRVYNADTRQVLGPDATGAINFPVSHTTAPWIVGARSGGTYFYGLIDEVVVSTGVWSVESIDAYFAKNYKGV